VTASELCPRGRVLRIQVEHALVQLPRRIQIFAGAHPLQQDAVRAQVVLVDFRVRRHIRVEGHLFTGTQIQRERTDNATDQIVVQLEQITDRDFGGVTPQHLTGRRAHQVCADTQPLVDAHDRAGQYGIHLGVLRDSHEIERFGCIVRAHDRRPDDQGAQADEPARDRVGHAQRQEIGIGVRPQHAERQDQQARESTAGYCAALRCHPLYGGNEAVPASRQRLHELRNIGRIAQRGAQPLDSRVQAMLEIDERVSRPQPAVQFLPREELAGPLDERGQQADRLILNRDFAPRLAEFARAEIELEACKPNEVQCARHGQEPRR
jgi:hypothetical protein